MRGGGLRLGGQGSNGYVLCAEPKEHKHFRPGTRPGGSVTGVTVPSVYVPNVYVPNVYVPFMAPKYNLVNCWGFGLQRIE